MGEPAGGRRGRPFPGPSPAGTSRRLEACPGEAPHPDWDSPRAPVRPPRPAGTGTAAGAAPEPVEHPSGTTQKRDGSDVNLTGTSCSDILAEGGFLSMKRRDYVVFEVLIGEEVG